MAEISTASRERAEPRVHLGYGERRWVELGAGIQAEPVQHVLVVLMRGVCQDLLEVGVAPRPGAWRAAPVAFGLRLAEQRPWNP